MLYATLICSDPDCAAEFEGWGDPDDFDAMACECGCTVEVIAFCEYREATIAPVSPRLELRLAA
jgi:hypothetical protein